VNPLSLVLAAWLVPGAGHLLQGRRQKALVFSVAVLGMFAGGLALDGRLLPFTPSDPLVLVFAAAMSGAGLPYGLAVTAGLGAGDTTSVWFDYGVAYLVVAGLLNALVVLDAYDISQGRK
jgi:hypothetical protein